MEYPITEDETTEIENKHTYHPPTPEQVEKYPKIREKTKELEILIRQLVPPSRERSIAITHLETSTFWANAGIARNENKDD